ncbi:hypothetical protein [Streptomyces sp. NPDC053427]|uniref:hypothetical protein n=1 Tax=Streptomyces sp. NPDC053427 TaxID=3365701 RepID=UPI0037CF9473
MTETDDGLARANRALEHYGLSEAGWRRTPGENLQELLADLLRWCDATQHGFDRALRAARASHAARERGAGGSGQVPAG